MITAALIIGILILVATVACAFIYKMAFYSGRKVTSISELFPDDSQYSGYLDRITCNIRLLEDTPCEKVEIRSRDGLKLYGRYYRSQPGKPIVIMFHGFRSEALRDSSGGGPYMIGRGYGVILVDQRSHGESDGRAITFGVKERLDCRDWIDYVIDREGADVTILLSGLSMGAATVLMAADTDLPSNVKGILADCPFSSPMEIISKVGADMKIPPVLAKPFVRFTARLFAGFSINESSAISAVRNLRIPALLIHGKADNFVPCEMSRRIAAANPEFCCLIEIDGAGHAMSYYVDTPGYRKALDNFCAQIEESCNGGGNA